VSLAIGLCLPIVVVLVGLNALGGEGEAIDPEYFRELLDLGLVEEIRLEGGAAGWLWPVGMVLLLGLGAVHLLLQARHHRRHGGPRQRLLDAERQLLNGELSREEYDRLTATISMEL